MGAFHRISYPPHVRKLGKCPQDTERGECSPALQGAFNHEGREVFIPGWMFPAGLPSSGLLMAAGAGNKEQIHLSFRRGAFQASRCVFRLAAKQFPALAISRLLAVEKNMHEC
jgi:hypothetical protein